MTERIALNIDDRKLPGFITGQTFETTFYFYHIIHIQCERNGKDFKRILAYLRNSTLSGKLKDAFWAKLSRPDPEVIRVES